MQAASALAALALVSGCTSGGASGAKATASAIAPSTTPIHVVRVHQLPKGVIASIRLPIDTAPIAAIPGFGSLWVVGHHGSIVSRVNPRTNKIIAKISVGGSCFSPVMTATRVVIGTCDLGNVVIDPQTNRVVGALGHVKVGGPPVRAQRPSAFGLQSPIAYEHGTPWTFGGGGIERLDPRTFRPNGATYPVNANPHHVTDPDIVATYADGFWWVVNFGDEDGLWGGQVVKVDPSTGQQTHIKVPNPGKGPDLETFGHAMWLKSISNDRLVRMDTRTRRLTTYKLPGWAPLDSFFPQVITVARHDLWIRVRSGRIIRWDPRKKRVVATYPADPSAGGGYETVAFGSLWVMNYNDDTVWRVRLKS